jgi:hypothetical protein
MDWRMEFIVDAMNTEMAGWATISFSRITLLRGVWETCEVIQLERESKRESWNAFKPTSSVFNFTK